MALAFFGLHTNQGIIRGYFAALEGYFDCEAPGILHGNTTRCSEQFHSIQAHSYPAFFLVTLLLLALAPVVYLTFLFNWNLCKAKLIALLASDSETSANLEGSNVS